MSKITQSYFPIQQSNFTILNQGTTTLYDGYNCILVNSPNKSGHNLCCLVQPVTSAYSITANIQRHDFNSGWNEVGVCFRSSSDGYITVVRYTTAGNSGLLNCKIYVSRFTSYTGFNGEVYVSAANIFYDIRWFRLTDDGVNRKCLISYDGINWQSIYSVSRTTFHTPDQAGWFCNNYSGIVNFTVKSFVVDYSS